MTTEKQENKCYWCNKTTDYTIIDDDFGQPIRLINYCFHCGNVIKNEKHQREIICRSRNLGGIRIE